MHKKVIQKIMIILDIILLSFLFSTAVKAASLKITASKSKVKPGESFKVTVSLSGGAGPITASVSNGTGSKTEFLDNNSLTFTCKAGKSGTVKISASGTVGDYKTEKDVKVSQAKTVKIQEKVATSNNSTKTATTKKEEEPKKEEITQETKDERYLLTSLTIEDELISPEFNSETFEYELKVENKEKLNIIAKANQNDAIIEIAGNENLKIGENIITISLKGQDDKETTTYTLKVLREKSELETANEIIKELKNRNTILIATTSLFIIITIVLGCIIVYQNYNKRK